MTDSQRIAAGGITLKGDSILLVRYNTSNGNPFLVCPGGGLLSGENAPEAVARETMEETNLLVKPLKVLWIEDLQCPNFKMCKIWILCEYLGGEIIPTSEAKDEGIIEAGWFSKHQLHGEVVFPPPIMQYDWNEFRSEKWQVQCLPSRIANM